MQQRPVAYQGSDPYIFISYAHKDAGLVYPLITQLQQRGLRIWYDEGIEVGSHWDRVIPQRILDSVCMICFVSRNFLASENCLDETHFAKEKKKGPLLIYLEWVEIPIEVEFRASRLHALSLEQFPNTNALIEKILDTRLLRPCICAEVPGSSPVPGPAAASFSPALTAEELFRRGKSAYDEENYAEALVLLQRAAEQEHPEGIYALSDCYMEGNGVEMDRQKALELVSKAAQLGSPTAQWALGLYCQSGFYVEKNILTAIRWFRKGAEAGHPRAQYCLAECYHTGDGVPADPREALRWFYKAAEQGLETAQFYVGMYYENGIAVPQNYETAALWYRLAAEQDLGWACQALGECFRQGLGVEQSYEEAVKWYLKAAGKHDPDAHFSLAQCYNHGNGVPRDPEKMLFHYREAAQRGHFGAQFNLGMLYFHGDGVEQDYPVAKYYFTQAAKSGLPQAQEMADACQRKIDQPKWWPF